MKRMHRILGCMIWVGALSGGDSWAAPDTAARPAYTPPAVLTWAGFLQVILSLALVLGLMGAIGWLLRRFRWPGGARDRSSLSLRVISSLPVGQRERVVVVEVKDTWLVLGVASGQVRTLHVMKPDSAERVSSELH